ncbi:hypothetical protein BJ138DRAFT_1178652 [Hygrophoropsis aurantiaca]|uniref:Uncharacterized protein n=1 Tax=Hygrophoropsis aurantiaca TaxID=72124 RepID=A0ACB8AHJ1_9AGAM|nr:hypothetical protein BJ138DRAFT_1178652 [Hygrophoropsis aurantiaca]
MRSTRPLVAWLSVDILHKLATPILSRRKRLCYTAHSFLRVVNLVVWLAFLFKINSGAGPAKIQGYIIHQFSAPSDDAVGKSFSRGLELLRVLRGVRLRTYYAYRHRSPSPVGAIDIRGLSCSAQSGHDPTGNESQPILFSAVAFPKKLSRSHSAFYESATAPPSDQLCYHPMDVLLDRISHITECCSIMPPTHPKVDEYLNLSAYVPRCLSLASVVDIISIFHPPISHAVKGAYCIITSVYEPMGEVPLPLDAGPCEHFTIGAVFHEATISFFFFSFGGDALHDHWRMAHPLPTSRPRSVSTRLCGHITITRRDIITLDMWIEVRAFCVFGHCSVGCERIK